MVISRQLLHRMFFFHETESAPTLVMAAILRDKCTSKLLFIGSPLKMAAITRAN